MKEGRRIKKILGIFILFLFLERGLAGADKGFIPFDSQQKIYEPKQRAVIAWDGKEEIMILTTELRASGTTKVLEVLPLPSEPAVKKGEAEVFKKIEEFIRKKLGRKEVGGYFGVGGAAKGLRAITAGEVISHQIIGAHDISVTHVLDGNGFVRWVENYLKTSGVDNPAIPEAMKEIVARYIKEGFNWFIFDVVELDKTLKTNDAIQYRFATKFLFYPLRITQTVEGETNIELLVFTPEQIKTFFVSPTLRLQLPHEPINVEPDELREISEEIDDLFGRRSNSLLRTWIIRNKATLFSEDLIVYHW